MRNCFIILLALVLPLFTYAEKPSDPSTIKIFEFLQCIDAERRLAREFLKHADEMTVLIPDLEKRSHIHALLASAIVSLAAAPDKRVMFLSIGLSLIASLSSDMYDQFCEYRRILILAEYHLDLYYFYDYVYRHLPRGEMCADGNPCRIGLSSFLRGMNYLFYSSRMAFSIHDKLEKNKIILDHISDFTNWISETLKKYKYRLSKDVAKKIHERAIRFSENFNEVLSECENENLRSVLNLHLREMLIQFQLAEKYSSDFTRCRTVK